MTKVIADITMSLDGFVTGPDAGIEHGLGIGGEPLHNWAIKSDDKVDAEVLQEAVGASGAVVMGRRLFDIVDSPNGWKDGMGYGASHDATPPFFVVTHSVPKSVRLEGLFTFVTDGLESALREAGQAAGPDDVVVMGGGDVIAQCVNEGLLDELRLHVAPMLLGSGTPLFRNGEIRHLTLQSARVSPNAAHLAYRM